MMVAIIASAPKDFADSSGHWYTKSGDPAYTIVGANGKLRNTTLRDARTLGLVPSVSTILKLEAAPQLTNWLVKQGMLACLTLPRNKGETEDAFMERALADSKAQVIKAAKRGTYLHGMLEESVRLGSFAYHASVVSADGTRKQTEEDISFIQPVLDWLATNMTGYTWQVERSFAADSAHGWYGGKLDLTGTHPTLPPAVLDYKAKDFSDITKKLAYDQHVTQLAAYGAGLYKTLNVRCINLFVSSTSPGVIVAHEWKQKEIDAASKAFFALLDLWNARKGT